MTFGCICLHRYHLRVTGPFHFLKFSLSMDKRSSIQPANYLFFQICAIIEFLADTTFHCFAVFGWKIFKMSLRMELSSEDSKLKYPANKPYDFRVHLSTPISLTGYWTVSLLEIFIEHGQAFKYPTSELFVFSNLCDNRVLGGHDVPLLRRVWLKDNKQNIIYQVPYDVSLRMGQFQDVHIYLNDPQGNQTSFIEDKVSVTLHLKKLPFTRQVY